MICVDWNFNFFARKVFENVFFFLMQNLFVVLMKAVTILLSQPFSRIFTHFATVISARLKG